MRLELEKAKRNSDKATVVLDKGLLLYFAFLLTAVLGYVNGFVNPTLLNGIIIVGFAILVVVLISYIRATKQEQITINQLINKLKLKRGAK
jgi:hypothetical protein